MSLFALLPSKAPQNNKTAEMEERTAVSKTRGPAGVTPEGHKGEGRRSSLRPGCGRCLNREHTWAMLGARFHLCDTVSAAEKAVVFQLYKRDICGAQ